MRQPKHCTTHCTAYGELESRFEKDDVAVPAPSKSPDDAFRAFIDLYAAQGAARKVLGTPERVGSFAELIDRVCKSCEIESSRLMELMGNPLGDSLRGSVVLPLAEIPVSTVAKIMERLRIRYREVVTLFEKEIGIASRPRRSGRLRVLGTFDPGSGIDAPSPESFAAELEIELKRREALHLLDEE